MKRLFIIMSLLFVGALFSVSSMDAKETDTPARATLKEEVATFQVKLADASSQEEYDALVSELKQIISKHTATSLINCGITCYIEYYKCLANCNNTRACQGYCNLSLDQCNRGCE